MDDTPVTDRSIVIGSGQVERQANRRKPKLLIIAIIVVVVLLGLGLVWWINSRNNQPEVAAAIPDGTSKICSDQLIRDASSAIGASDMSKLDTVAVQVQAIERHQHDVNCNYIVARYFIMAGQYDKAGQYVENVSHQRNRGVAYSGIFDPPADAPEVLRSALDTGKSNTEAGESRRNTEGETQRFLEEGL